MAFSYIGNRKWAGDSRFLNHEGPTGSALAKVRQLEAYYFYFNELGKAFVNKDKLKGIFNLILRG